MIHHKKLTGIGIVGYGSYVPRLRIRISEIASSYGVDGKQVEQNLCVKQKSVAQWDEDVVTLAYMASSGALSMANIDATKIGALYIGSESHPYAVKTTSTIVGEALGVGHEYMAADLEFACKAGTSGVQLIASHLLSGVISYGLAVGADVAQAEPGDLLEYTAAAGGAALLLGKRRILARLTGFFSYCSDTSDFWRRSEQKLPQHAGRFTGEPAYFRHIIAATEAFFKASKTNASTYDHVVFHMPNGKFPVRAAQRLGFGEKQLKHGFIVSEIGNPYSASTLLGLCRVLDNADNQQRILLVSYGSGAGSDVLSFFTTPLLARYRRRLSQAAHQPTYLSYGAYRAMVG